MSDTVRRSSFSGITSMPGAETTNRTGRLGDHQVETGRPEGRRPPEAGFREKAAAFFSSIGEKFRDFGRALASIPGRIQDSHERWQTSRANAKLAEWTENAPDLKADRRTKHHLNNNMGDTAIQNLQTAKAALGAPGLHAMANEMLRSFMELAANDTNANLQKVPPGQPVTWQERAQEGLRTELLKSPRFKDAESTIKQLESHFKTYEKADGQGDLASLSRIISGLKAEVTDLASVDALARNAFSAEVGKELRDVEQFFRGNSDASVGAATIMRNANPKQSATMAEAFADMLTSSANREAVDVLKAMKLHDKPTAEQQRMINQMTDDFLNRAFGLQKDGGEKFISRFDDTARSFLRDTGQQIADNHGVDADTRNSAIRKWFSNGIALRDLAPIAMRVSEEHDLKSVGNLVATNILRVVADVQANNTTAQKMSPEGLNVYRDYIAERGPQFTELLQRLGMPTAA